MIKQRHDCLQKVLLYNKKILTINKRISKIISCSFLRRGEVTSIQKFSSIITLNHLLSNIIAITTFTNHCQFRIVIPQNTF